jgi:hypothetical protein
MPALPQLYPYKSGPMEPVVMPGETVGIWVNKAFSFYQVEFIEGVPPSEPLEETCGALAVGAQSAVTQLNLLEMPDHEFGQFRMRVIDDVSVILFQGRADQRHKVMNTVATATRYTNVVDPCGHTTEFFVYEDNWAYMQAQNQTDYALGQSRVAFYGYRYVVEPLTQYSWANKVLPPVWTRIPATAHL